MFECLLAVFCLTLPLTFGQAISLLPVARPMPTYTLLCISPLIAADPFPDACSTGTNSALDVQQALDDHKASVALSEARRATISAAVSAAEAEVTEHRSQAGVAVAEVDEVRLGWSRDVARSTGGRTRYYLRVWERTCSYTFG